MKAMKKLVNKKLANKEKRKKKEERYSKTSELELKKLKKEENR